MEAQLSDWRETEEHEDIFPLTPAQQEFRDMTDVVWYDAEEAYAQRLGRGDGNLRNTPEEREVWLHNYCLRHFVNMLRQVEETLLQKLGQLGGPDDAERREEYELVGRQHSELQEWVRTYSEVSSMIDFNMFI